MLVRLSQDEDGSVKRSAIRALTIRMKEYDLTQLAEIISSHESPGMRISAITVLHDVGHDREYSEL